MPPEAIPPSHRKRRAILASVVGIAAGLGLATWLLAGRAGEAEFVEREEYRPLASEPDVREWSAEWDRRAKPHVAVPDPPGEGPVVSARFWLSRPAYDMEVRRRGDRFVVEIHGIDVQTMGGGWSAFGEGRITGDPRGFAGSVATFAWSCLGIRYRSGSDGVARLEFGADGKSVVAVYSAWESWAVPADFTFAKAYGIAAEGTRPAYAALRGQIPYLPRMRRHAPDAKVEVRGRVVTPDGAAVPNALVQVKGVDPTRTHADAEGRFALTFRGRDAPWAQSICAGAIGYRNGETVLFSGDPVDAVVVEVTPLDPVDHKEYAWQHPAPDKDPDDAMACGTCHSWQYVEWLSSRHARSADHGHVVWERERMLAARAAAPDDCAGCHQPAWAATTGRGEYVPRGVLASNHCDFCHKVHRTDRVGGAGALGGLTLLRPDPASRDRPGTIHHVFGPSADATFAYMGASYAPHLSTSWLCAGCHEGGGVPGAPKVSTFTEWKAWAAEREDDRFRECQDCHMPPGVTKTIEDERVDLFAWESLHRRPAAVHSHAFPGTTKALAKDALEVAVEKAWDAGTSRWNVTVRVKNVGAGHKVPTGTWSKHVAIGVWARQSDRWLASEGGSRARLLPAGAPEPSDPLAAGDWRDPPGAILGVFVKGREGVLPDFWAPPPPERISDERLSPGQTRTIVVGFLPAGNSPGPEPVVEVRIVHRRGPIGAGPEETPWEIHPYDPPPEVLWMRIVR